MRTAAAASRPLVAVLALASPASSPVGSAFVATFLGEPTDPLEAGVVDVPIGALGTAGVLFLS